MRPISRLADYQREADAAKTATQQLHDALGRPASSVFGYPNQLVRPAIIGEVLASPNSG